MDFLSIKIDQFKRLLFSSLDFCKKELEKYTHKQIVALVASGSVLSMLLGWKSLIGFVLGIIFNNFIKDGF
jgi:hypothetical protein